MENFINFDTESNQLICQGEWDITHLQQIQQALKKLHWPTTDTIIINGEAITKMDSAGAWLLSSEAQQLKQKNTTIRFDKFSKDKQTLLTIIEKQQSQNIEIPEPKKLSKIGVVGKNTLEKLDEFHEYLAFVGQLTMEALRIIRHSRYMRWNALVSVIDNAGLRALPIIALLSFLIGVVLAYQMGVQLRNYGANVFIVNLLGLSVLREFGPLITAIMIAGRTGSAFTAQLGIMKINQEIDALNTMGVTPGELLLLPRIIGLFIALPLLTVWADIFGILGGMTMASSMLHIGWHDFLVRFQHEIPLRAFIIGFGKAPVFALLIASIGCFQGMRVENTADSLGKNTTRSVVLGIFFIIVADAVFSILFSRLKL